jgi:uncharacterized ParB-like nuclease family protein
VPHDPGVDLVRLQEVSLSALVRPLRPVQVIHGIPVSPVHIQLLDGCELHIVPPPANHLGRLALIRGTLLYAFVGVGLRSMLTSYTGISELVDGSRVITSFRKRTAEMRPAALVLLTRPVPYSLDMLKHLEAAVLKRLTMRTRALNAQSSAREASLRLSARERALADALAQQIADAISCYGLGGLHNAMARNYRNSRDLAAGLIHRLGGRALDSYQAVDMLHATGAHLTALRKDYVVRRDLIQRERDGGNVRVDNIKVDGVAVFFPAGVVSPQQAAADYAGQRRRHGRGRLPVPAPATGIWCRCPYCTPATGFTIAVVNHVGGAVASPSP